jgi:hypothetical protein
LIQSTNLRAIGRTTSRRRIIDCSLDRFAVDPFNDDVDRGGEN